MSLGNVAREIESRMKESLERPPTSQTLKRDVENGAIFFGVIGAATSIYFLARTLFNECGENSMCKTIMNRPVVHIPLLIAAYAAAGATATVAHYAVSRLFERAAQTPLVQSTEQVLSKHVFSPLKRAATYLFGPVRGEN